MPTTASSAGRTCGSGPRSGRLRTAGGTSWSGHPRPAPLPAPGPGLGAALVTARRRSQPTLITTGTGSGKTEAFLIPILDHCRRERSAGRQGIKAVLLYPMNALATDQALRLNGLLSTQPELRAVTAGLYVGEVPDTTYPKVLTERSDIRRSRPDILITNYKMLDLLLQRADDLPLWEAADIRYVVVDEFHTYDGAQGTDVAMLLRRLAAATGHAEPGRPLGRICPVATSATLGDNSDQEEIRKVAGNVFGTAFAEDSVITEQRQVPDEFVGDLDFGLPLPGPRDIAILPDPHRSDPGQSEEAMREIARVVTGRDERLSPGELGRILRGHILTRALMDVLGDRPLTSTEILEVLPGKGAYSWGSAFRSNPAQVATALARFVALLSTARSPQDPERPLLHIESHLWIRPPSRLVRLVSRRAAFGWQGEAAPESETTVGGTPRESLPAIYCRHCGRSGWAAISPEKDPQDLDPEASKVYRAAVSRDKRLVRAFIEATKDEVAACASGDRNSPAVLVLAASGRRVRPLIPAKDIVNGDYRGRGRARSGTSCTRRRRSGPLTRGRCRPAASMTAPGSSARAWRVLPPSRSPSCSPAGNCGQTSRGCPHGSRRLPIARRARPCCSTTLSRTPRTVPG